MMFIEYINITKSMSINMYVYIYIFQIYNIYILCIGQCTKLICQHDYYNANILSLHRLGQFPGAPRPSIPGPLHESAILLLKLLDIGI